jgi:type I restriction enzyme S subunit
VEPALAAWLEDNKAQACLRNPFQRVDKHTVEGEASVRLCNYLDVYRNERITPSMEFMAASASADEVRRFAHQSGDVLITKDSDAWTDIAVPAVVDGEFDGVLCGYHLAMIRPDPQQLEGRFLARAFQAVGIREQFHIEAKGITRFGLSGDGVASAQFPLPPVSEQRVIADFLDRETAKIDALLEERTRLVQLLEERLQRSIDSTIEMLQAKAGKTKLKYLLTRSPRNGISPRITESGTVPTFSTAAMVGNAIVIDGHVKYADAPHKAVREFLVHRDDVLVLRGSGSKRLVGRGGIVKGDPPEGCVYPDILIRLRPLPSIDRSRLVEVINSGVCRPQIERCAKTASGIWKITGEDIGNLSVPLALGAAPNSTLGEVRLARESFSRTATQIQRSVTVLREHRSALITAAVTGEIDVRSHAP